MTKPAAYLRPRMGHALSQTAGSVLTLAHQAFVRRGSEQVAAIVPSAEMAALTDQDTGSGMPVHRAKPAAFDQSERGPKAPTAPQHKTKPVAQTPLAPFFSNHRAPDSHRETGPSQQGLKLVANTQRTDANTPTEQPDKRPDTALSPQILAHMLVKAAERRQPVPRAQIAPLQMLQSKQPPPNGHVHTPANTVFAARIAQVQGREPSEQQTPADKIWPQQQSGNGTAPTADRKGGFLGDGTTPLSHRNTAQTPETGTTATGSLSALVDSLLRQNAQSAPPYAAPNSAAPEDDFDFETRLRAALADILAQDMLRHGLRIPGVF